MGNRYWRDQSVDQSNLMQRLTFDFHVRYHGIICADGALKRLHTSRYVHTDGCVFYFFRLREFFSCNQEICGGKDAYTTPVQCS